MIKFSAAAEVVSRGRREGGIEKKEEVGEWEEGLGREIKEGRKEEREKRSEGKTKMVQCGIIMDIFIKSILILTKNTF